MQAFGEIVDAPIELQKAIVEPEYMLNHWIELPTSPKATKTPKRLQLREAILLALRYNANIQSAELDRIIQRYDLRLAHNEFELQYALAGTAIAEKNNFSGIGGSSAHSFLATPEVSLKTKLGTSMQLKVQNSVNPNGSYAPNMQASITQPLLQGFGISVNEAPLLDAIDTDFLNKLNLKQSVIDQITEVILAYRTLIVSGNTLKNQERQLEEAKQSFTTNEKKIKAGQMEPSANIQQSYQIESLSLLVEQANNDLQTAAQNLLEAIGLDPKTRVLVPSDVEVGTIKIPNIQESIQLALRFNTQYLAKKLLINSDERAYKVAKNKQLWELSLGASVDYGLVSNPTAMKNGQNLPTVYNGNNLNQSVNVSLKVPLQDLNRRSALINAKVRLEKDRLNLIAAKRALETNITNTINSIESQAKRYELAKKQVRLAEESYKLEKKKMQAGFSSALDVSNTQNQLIQAQSGLINAKIAYLNQLSALERMLGTTLKNWNITLRYGE